jgi:hypothetical protein
MKLCNHCGRFKSLKKFYKKSNLCKECYKKNQRDKHRPPFDIEKGCFQQIRLTKGLTKWDIELAIETCRNLDNPLEWVTAVFYDERWYVINETYDYYEAKKKHRQYYDDLFNNRKNIKKYLTFELKVLR